MADVTFKFRIVLNSQGSLSGPELITQIEDGINQIGTLAAESDNQSSQALQQAQQAVETANSAQSTANNALANANSAIEQTQTLGQTVAAYDTKITNAVSQATSAVTAANTAVSTANSAVTSANQAKEAAESAASQAQTAATNAASSASAAETAQTAAQTAQEQAQDAQTSAQQAQQQAQEAQQAAEEASTNSNIIHAYDGTLTAGGTVPIANLVPATGKQGDLIADETGVLYQIIGVTDGTATISDTGSVLTGFVSYAIAQTLTEEQQTQSLENQGVIQALTELIQENGGTVPTDSTESDSTEGTETLSADPWADYED